MSSLVIIGQGYVGLPLARAAVKAGLTVVGLDLNAETVAALNSGLSHVGDVTSEDIAFMRAAGYRASTDASLIQAAEYVVLCVPTPLGSEGQPDLSAVLAATRDVSDNLNTGTTVVLESTTYPGTTENLLLPILEKSGYTLDTDFWLAFSPERIDPGNTEYGVENTPKVVGGVTPMSTTKASSLYERFVSQVVPVRSAKEAETAKLLENTYRHINIALVNEMVRFCHELEIDLWDVINAAKTKPFGFQAFYPGPGVGGHCIPIDPNYLGHQVRKILGYPFRFVELAEEINNSMPRYVVDRVQDELNKRGKPLKNSEVLLLGVTYKANIADQRESPAAPLEAMLRKKGAAISFHDPRVENWAVNDHKYTRVRDLSKVVATADIVVLLQNHREYDSDFLASTASIFFDTRGASSRGTEAIRL